MVKHNKHRGGMCNYTSGSSFQLGNLGTMDQQTGRVMNSTLGNLATQHSNSINTMSNVNSDNNWPYLNNGGNNLYSNSMSGGSLNNTNFGKNIPVQHASNNLPKTTKGGKKHKGGNMISILKEAAAPAILFAANKMYKKSKGKFVGKSKRSRKQTRKIRGGNIASILGEAAVPAILFAANNSTRRRAPSSKFFRKNKKTFSRKY